MNDILNILLADDTAMNLSLGVKLLTRRGHNVTTAEDGLQAFETYKAGTFDVILMDVQMPVMGGIDSTREIRKYEGEHPEKILGIKGIKLTYVKLRTKDQPRHKNAIFELHHWERPKAPKQKWLGHISFTVDNMDREYKRLKRLGVKFISKPLKSPVSGHKLCFGYDPDGNLIEFADRN